MAETRFSNSERDWILIGVWSVIFGPEFVAAFLIGAGIGWTLFEGVPRIVKAVKGEETLSKRVDEGKDYAQKKALALRLRADDLERKRSSGNLVDWSWFHS